MAIRWDNVNNDLPEFSRGIDTVGKYFNLGMGNFNNIIQDQQKISNGNWDNQAKNNTNAYMDAIAEAKTPEEFQSKQAFLAQMRQGFGAQVDQEATRKAEEGRLALLQNRAIADIGYRTALDNEADLSKAGPANELMGNGDYTKAGEVIKTMSARGQAQWFPKLEAQRDKDTAQAQGNARFSQQLIEDSNKNARAPKEMELLDSQINENNAQADARRNKPLEEARARGIAQAKIDLAADAKTNPYGETFSTDPAVNTKHILDILGQPSGKDSGPERDAYKAIALHYADPKNAYFNKGKGDAALSLPYNASVIKQAVTMVNSGKKEGWGWNNSWGKSAGYGPEYVKQVVAAAEKLMDDSTIDDPMVNGVPGTLAINKPGAYNSWTRRNSLLAAARDDAPTTRAETGLPKPNGAVTTPVNAPVARLEEAAAKVTTPPEVKAEAGVPSKLSAAALDLAVAPFTAGGSVVTEAFNRSGLTDFKLTSPYDAYGAVPFSDALKRDPEMFPTPTAGQAPTIYSNGGLPADVIERNKATMRAQLNPNYKPPSLPNMPELTNAGIAGLNTFGVPGLLAKAAKDKYFPSNAPVAALEKAAATQLQGTTSVHPPQKPVEKYSWGIQEGKGTKVRIKRVLDGDTVEFESLDGKPIPNAKGNVGRFGSSDANETGKAWLGTKDQAMSQEAKDYLSTLSKDKVVTIQVTGQANRKDTDKTRNVIDIEIDGVPIEIAMIRAGYTHPNTRNHSPDSQRYKDIMRASQISETERTGVNSPENRSTLRADEERALNTKIAKEKLKKALNQ